MANNGVIALVIVMLIIAGFAIALSLGVLPSINSSNNSVTGQSGSAVSSCLNQVNSALTIGSTKLGPGATVTIVSAGQTVFYYKSNQTVANDIENWKSTWLSDLEEGGAYINNDVASISSNGSIGSIAAVGIVIQVVVSGTSVFPVLCNSNGELLGGSKTLIDSGFLNAG
jgi:type II secretory pathway pseudopilin PulG